MQGGGFIASVPDGLRWDAGAVQLQLLCGVAVLGYYDVPDADQANMDGVLTQHLANPRPRRLSLLLCWQASHADSIGT